MFHRIEETVTERRLDREPLPSPAHVHIPVVCRQRCEGFQTGPKRISGRQVHRVVPLAHIEGAAVGLHAFDDGGDHDVRIRITVVVRIGVQVVGQQEAADLDELRDWFAVVPGHARGKILRGFNATRCGFNRQTGDRHRCARTARIGVQDFIADQYPLRRVRVLNIQVLDVGRHRYRVRTGSQPLELQINRSHTAIGNIKIPADVEKLWRRCSDFVDSRTDRRESERTTLIGADLLRLRVAIRYNDHLCARHRPALRVRHLPGEHAPGSR